MPLCLQFVEHLYGVWDAAAERIICVHKQHAAIRKNIRICAERVKLGRKAHYPAVRMRARYRHAAHLPGKHVACACAAAYHCRTRAVYARVRSLRPPKAEFHHTVPICGIRNAGSLGGDKRLMIDQIEQRCFHKLRLHNGRLNADKRLVREHNGAFRHAVYFARETHIGQYFQEAFVKQIE